MSKRKPIEAWAVVVNGCTRLFQNKEHAWLLTDRGYKAVRLVEADPRAAAVLRAAIGHVLAVAGSRAKLRPSEKVLWAAVRRMGVKR